MLDWLINSALVNESSHYKVHHDCVERVCSAVFLSFFFFLPCCSLAELQAGFSGSLQDLCGFVTSCLGQSAN